MSETEILTDILEKIQTQTLVQIIYATGMLAMMGLTIYSVWKSKES